LVTHWTKMVYCGHCLRNVHGVRIDYAHFFLDKTMLICEYNLLCFHNHHFMQFFLFNWIFTVFDFLWLLDWIIDYGYSKRFFFYYKFSINFLFDYYWIGLLIMVIWMLLDVVEIVVWCLKITLFLRCHTMWEMLLER